VWAIAPVDSQLEDVKLKLEKRSAWIVKQKKYFEQFLPRTPEREYVAGETHNYLGKRYLLNVKSTTTDSVKLKAGVLMVTSKGNSKCIEYVFIHEFCHLVHPNHGKEFYSLLESILPEWERWKITLEKFMC